MARPLLFTAIVLLLAACGDDEPMPDASMDATTDAPIDAGADADGDADAGRPDLYPADPTPLDAEACRADHETSWVRTEACEGRFCVDARGRTWREGEPFIAKGLYQAAFEAELVFSNCPAGEECNATQPSDHDAYIATLTDAGFNMLVEERQRLSTETRAAVDANDEMYLTHVLFGEELFTEEGHATFVTEVEEAIADEKVLMWFGPDEPGLNNSWPMAAGFQRLLRGSSEEIDALLAGRYRPAGTPFLPEDAPAYDTLGLPYVAAVVREATGLEVASEVYEAMMPVTYPFQEPLSPANSLPWGTSRSAEYAVDGLPTMPVHQMGPIEGLGLARQSAEQLRSAVITTWVHGANGAFFYRIAGESDGIAGRTGWYAPDDVQAWQAFSEVNALWDALIPPLYSDAEVATGTEGVLEWRTLTLGERRIVLIANPTSFARRIDLDSIIARQDNEFVREYDGCTPFTTRALRVPGYATYVLEVTRSVGSTPGEPGDPLRGFPRPLPEEPDPEALGTWQALSPLAVGRSQFAVSRQGDEVQIFGGYAGALSGSRSALALGTDDVRPLPELPLGVAGASALATDEHVIVAGGIERFAMSGAVSASDRCQRLTGDAWSDCAPLGNGPTTAAASISFDGRLYLFGGTSREDFSEGGSGALATRIVQVYDPELDEWSGEAVMPEVRLGAAAFVHRGVAYIVGGLFQRGVTDPVVPAAHVLAYDLRAHAFVEGPADLVQPRVALACAARRGFAYCAGGYTDDGTTVASAHRLDLATGEWTALPDLPQPLSDLAAIGRADDVLFMGGLTTDFLDSNTLYSLQ